MPGGHTNHNQEYKLQFSMCVHHRSYENLPNGGPCGYPRHSLTHSVEGSRPCGNGQNNYEGDWRSQDSVPGSLVISSFFQLLVQPNDKMVNKYNFKKNFLARLSNKREREGGSFTYPLKANTIKLYIDGSKSDK